MSRDLIERFIELLKITIKIPEDHYCDECAGYFLELEEIFCKINDFSSLLTVQDTREIMKYFPKQKDYERYTAALLYYSSSFPCSELWNILLDEVVLELKIFALQSDLLNKENCLYFSFADSIPILGLEDFVQSLKYFNNPTYTDVDNIVFFIIALDYIDNKVSISKYDKEILSALKATSYNLQDNDLFSEQLIEICEKYDLPLIAKYFQI